LKAKLFFFEESGGAKAPAAKDLYLKKTRVQLYKGKGRGAELLSYRSFRGTRKKEKNQSYYGKEFIHD
jgi:hypothetical protein